MTNRNLELIDKGEIVNMQSILAFDEELLCRECNHIFVLAEGKWEGTHGKFRGVKAYGMQCPSCKNINITYYKTQSLFKLEQILEKAEIGKQKDKARKKYQREFDRVQKRFGGNV